MTWPKPPAGSLAAERLPGTSKERYTVRIKQRNRYGLGRGFNWYAPYDKLKKCFLTTPPKYQDQHGDLGSLIAGKVWLMLWRTDAEWYKNHTTPKEFARWERVLERRRLKEIERKLDKTA